MKYARFTVEPPPEEEIYTGPIKILRSLDQFAVLQGTPYYDIMSEVDSAVLEEALLPYGRVLPLLKQLGREPKYCLKLIPSELHYCRQFKSCLIADKDACRPGGPKPLPHCYEAPIEDAAVREAASIVVAAWADNRYVIRVK